MIFKESVIGKILESKSRQDIIVVSKAGYLPKDKFKSIPMEWNVADLSPTFAHSIEPSYLDYQISNSLEALQTNYIDIYMLNNPERMVHANNMHVPMTRLYDMIGNALLHLEKERQRGRILGFGITSSSMHTPNAVDHLDLQKVVEIAGQLGVLDGLVAVEYPLNLFERDAFISESKEFEPLGKTASRNNLYSLTQRPLNAIARGRIRKLAVCIGSLFGYRLRS